MNGTGFIQELMEMITRRAEVLARLEAQIEDTSRELEAVQFTLKLHLKDHDIPELSTKTANEPGGPSLNKRRGIALITWAEGHNGILRPKEAKKALVAAGLIKPGPGSGWIVYGTIGGMDCWEKIEPGVYKLIGYQPPVTKSTTNGMLSLGASIDASNTLTPSPSTSEHEPDYWRCPSGRLHEWSYFRKPDGTGIYICKNCPMQVDKATLKAKTDGGPKLYPDPVEG